MNPNLGISIWCFIGFISWILLIKVIERRKITVKDLCYGLLGMFGGPLLTIIFVLDLIEKYKDKELF